MYARKAILPINMDLCKPEILSKCLHDKTQNSNESFNYMIWNRVPKMYVYSQCWCVRCDIAFQLW